MNDGAPTLEDAEQSLADALGPAGSSSDNRERRASIARAIALAERALGAPSGQAPAIRARALRLIARANAALAELARHGAGQLSISAQRAPTAEECELGWQRVAGIVEQAQAFAAAAARAAAEVPATSPGAARDAASAAERAAQAASDAIALQRARNEAFTFHADEAFSFGEGWHVAAAALLTGAPLQIEADQRGSADVERFLADAALLAQVVAPRPRPRAQRQSTAMVARAFAADPLTAQRRLRRAWLESAPIDDAVRAFIEERMGPRGQDELRTIALWVRHGAHQPERNTDPAELTALVRCAREAGLRPLLLGEAPPATSSVEGAVDLTLHRLVPVFRGPRGRAMQLHLFELLRSERALIGQLGVTSAAMDGPALLGLATAYVTDAHNPRMGQWVGVVPGYEQVLRARGSGELEPRARALFARWASAPR